MNETEPCPDVRVGHVHLRVANLARATRFYRDALGFEVTAYGPDHGLPGAAFLAAGGYHHHIGLNAWTSEGGSPHSSITSDPPESLAVTLWTMSSAGRRGPSPGPTITFLSLTFMTFSFRPAPGPS